MKKIIFLAAAALVICGCSKNEKPQVKDNGLPKAQSAAPAAKVQGGIAYVEIDSLATQYDFCVEEQEKLKKKQAGYAAQLEKEGKALETAYNNFQKKIQEGKFTSEEQARSEQASLQRQQQSIGKKEEQYNEAMAKATSDYQNELLKRINEFLKDYNKDGRYSMILTNSQAALNVLYADSTLNITKDVIEGLNKAYKKK